MPPRRVTTGVSTDSNDHIVACHRVQQTIRKAANQHPPHIASNDLILQRIGFDDRQRRCHGIQKGFASPHSPTTVPSSYLPNFGFSLSLYNQAPGHSKYARIRLMTMSAEEPRLGSFL